MHESKASYWSEEKEDKVRAMKTVKMGMAKCSFVTYITQCTAVE